MYPQIITPSHAAARHKCAGADAPRETAAAIPAQKGPRCTQTICGSPPPKPVVSLHVRIFFCLRPGAKMPCEQKLVAVQAKVTGVAELGVAICRL